MVGQKRGDKVKLYRVEVAICTGKAKPLPFLDELPTYTFAVVGPDEPKRSATLRRNRLAGLNPGVSFVSAEVK